MPGMEPINRRAFPGGSGHPPPDPIKPTTSPWSSSSKAKGAVGLVLNTTTARLAVAGDCLDRAQVRVSAETLRKWPLLLQSSHRDDAALVCARDDHAATPPESRARLAVALALTPGGS